MGKRISQCTHSSSWLYLYRRHFSSEKALYSYYNNCRQNLQYTSQPAIYTWPSSLSVRNRDKCIIQRKLECWTVREAENNYSNSKSSLELKNVQMYWSKEGENQPSRPFMMLSPGQEGGTMLLRTALLFPPWWDTFQGPSCPSQWHPPACIHRRSSPLQTMTEISTSKSYHITAEQQEPSKCILWQKYGNLTLINQQ